MDNITLPDYGEIADRIYSLIVNQEVGHMVGRAEIKHALLHAERVGKTLGYETGFEQGRLARQKGNL